MNELLAQEAAEIAELEKEQAEPEVKAEPETKEPEAKAEAPEEHDDTVELDNKGRFVRHGAFHAEREQRKQWQQKASDWEARYAQDMAKVNERLAVIAQQRQAAGEPQQETAPEIQVPDVNSDPIGHFQAKTALLEKKLAEVDQYRQAQQRNAGQQDTLQKIGAEVSRLEAEYAKSVPDYAQAQEYLQKQWSNQAALLGATPQQAVQFYAQQIVRAAAAQNRNPAEIAYEFAKSLGYQKQQAAPEQKQTSGPDLDTIKKGIATTKASGPAKAAPGVPTIEALLEMDDTEFANKYGGRDNKEWDRMARKLFGAAPV